MQAGEVATDRLAAPSWSSYTSSTAQEMYLRPAQTVCMQLRHDSVHRSIHASSILSIP
jgi:hypothetical protein